MKRLTHIALTAALLCICSWITVPFTVPFTMQTFAVFLALLLLGGKDGTIAICLYLLLGVVGLPVFSGFRGGLGHLLGPTGGYLVGFVFSGVVYMLLEPAIRRNRRVRWAALLLGLLVCYAFGTAWFVLVFARKGTSYSILSALGICVLPYVVPDVLKAVLAVAVSDRVKKAGRKE